MHVQLPSCRMSALKKGVRRQKKEKETSKKGGEKTGEKDAKNVKKEAEASSGEPRSQLWVPSGPKVEKGPKKEKKARKQHYLFGGVLEKNPVGEGFFVGGFLVPCRKPPFLILGVEST